MGRVLGKAGGKFVVGPGEVDDIFHGPPRLKLPFGFLTARTTLPQSRIADLQVYSRLKRQVLQSLEKSVVFPFALFRSGS